MSISGSFRKFKHENSTLLNKIFLTGNYAGSRYIQRLFRFLVFRPKLFKLLAFPVWIKKDNRPRIHHFLVKQQQKILLRGTLGTDSAFEDERILNNKEAEIYCLLKGYYEARRSL